MKKVFGKKMLQTLSITALMLGITSSAMAIDTIVVIPQIITGHSVYERTDNVLYGISNDRDVISVFFDTFLMLPFAILDQKSNSINVNENDLSELNYSAEEISEYKNDILAIQDLSAARKFTSSEEARKALSTLELGVVAKEQLRLK
jgi:hypothetical protein